MQGKSSSSLDLVLAAMLCHLPMDMLVSPAGFGPEVAAAFQRKSHHLPTPTPHSKPLEHPHSKGSSVSSVTRLCPLENTTFPEKPVLSTYQHMVLC